MPETAAGFVLSPALLLLLTCSCVQVFLETGGAVRDVALTKELNPATLSFEQWADENKEWLISSLFTPK